MGFFDKYPYTDFHELNLDWILKTVKNLCQEMDDWEAVNAITFSGTWDITKQYPAWTIVSDNNIGYVSIKPVPAGILLTDGTYWRAVIDYTAQIAGLQTRVVALENTVGDNTSGLVKDVNDLQNTVGNSTSGLVKDVNDLQNKFNISQKRIILMSDSYGLIRNGVTPWTDRVISSLNGIVSDIYNLSQGSMGFNRAGDQGTNALAFLQANESSIPNHDTITDFYILMGANDSLAVTGLNTAISNFITYVLTKYPNAIIHCGFVGNQLAKNTSTLKNYVNALNLYRKGFEGVNSCEYIEAGEPIMHNSENVSSDLLHPSADGASELAKMMMACLFNSVYRYVTPIKSTSFTLTDMTGSIDEFIDGHTLHRTITINTLNHTFSNNQFVDMGAITDQMIYGEGGYVQKFSFIMPDTSNNTKPLILYIYNSHIYAGVEGFGTGASFNTSRAVTAECGIDIILA